jgi:hypothetical protein
MEAGLLPDSPSILLMVNAHLSTMGLVPNEEEGEGSGCEFVMNIDSDRGVWFPPRPFEGGTPTSLVDAMGLLLTLLLVLLLSFWDDEDPASSA